MQYKWQNNHRRYKDRICYFTIWIHQLINEPTLKDFSSCTDLIFTSQPSLVVDSGVHLSLHLTCHHQFVYAKFNLKIHFPPLYERKIWHYGQEKTEFIRREVHEFNWQRVFSNLNINKNALKILDINERGFFQ